MHNSPDPDRIQSGEDLHVEICTEQMNRERDHEPLEGDVACTDGS